MMITDFVLTHSFSSVACFGGYFKLQLMTPAMNCLMLKALTFFLAFAHFSVIAVSCFATDPHPDIKKHLIQEIEDSSEWPKSGKLEGKLTLERIEKRGNTKLVRCDFRVWFAGRRVRVERDYQADRLNEEELLDYWCPITTGFNRQIYLSNDRGEHLVAFDGDRKQCLVFSEPSRERFTRNVDFPCYQTSQILINPQGSLESLTKITAFKDDQTGTFMRGSDPTFTYYFGFLPQSPKLLSQEIVSRGEKRVSKLDINWSTAGKYGYVDKYTQSFLMHTRKRRLEYELEVEYTSFEPDLKIAPELFTISSMGVSVGTVFTDPAPYPPAAGKNSSFVFDGEKLVNAKDSAREGSIRIPDPR